MTIDKQDSYHYHIIKQSLLILKLKYSQECAWTCNYNLHHATKGFVNHAKISCRSFISPTNYYNKFWMTIMKYVIVKIPCYYLAIMKTVWWWCSHRIVSPSLTAAWIILYLEENSFFFLCVRVLGEWVCGCSLFFSRVFFVRPWMNECFVFIV